MITLRRPVFVCGENPGLTLYEPDSDRRIAVASYWDCMTSPWGRGQALVLWVEPAYAIPSGAQPAGIFTNNLALAHGLVQSLTQHFAEFRGIPLSDLPYKEATCNHSFDGDRYQVVCGTATTQLALVWEQIVDQKQVSWPQFPAGPEAYDLTTVICPCREARIAINGIALVGAVQLAQAADGTPASSAFLAFAESWIGPFDPTKADPT